MGSVPKRWGRVESGWMGFARPAYSNPFFSESILHSTYALWRDSFYDVTSLTTWLLLRRHFSYDVTSFKFASSLFDVFPSSYISFTTTCCWYYAWWNSSKLQEEGIVVNVMHDEMIRMQSMDDCNQYEFLQHIISHSSCYTCRNLLRRRRTCS